MIRRKYEYIKHNTIKTLKIKFILRLSLVFISASCAKQEPEPVFAQGFSCKINGEEWVAKSPASIGGPVALEGYYNDNSGTLVVKATLKDNDINIYEGINIYGLVNIYSTSQVDMIVIDGNGVEHDGFINLSNNADCGGYFHDSLNPGNIKICSLDKVKREMSGKFNMTLINRDCTDSLMYITDGKFAFRY